MKNTFLIFISLVITTIYGQENPVGTNIGEWMELKHAWQAWWITPPKASGFDYGVFHFRKNFELPSKPENFIVHVSADNRYILYVNGQWVSEGPARGDFMHWNYETIDIAQYLQKGKNTIAAQVYNLGKLRPVAQFSRATAFILQGNTKNESVVNTDNSWNVIKNEAYSPITVSEKNVHGFYVAGPCDSIVAEKNPWGWELSEFDDSKWLHPNNWVVDRGNGPGYIHGAPYNLVKRTIPPMEKKTERFSKIVRTSNVNITDDSFLKGFKPLTIPANTSAKILIDNAVLTVGYPQLRLSGGKNAIIKISYAEALFDKNGRKGNRSILEGKELTGNYDVIIADGGTERLFAPLWLRTFRFVELEITTKDNNLVINDLTTIFTAYPLQEKAKFNFFDTLFPYREIWNTAWHTARLCANETYWDCPYYEQLQYVGDTRVQSLISLYVSGDDRLMRNAITQINNSIIPEGLTLCRAPSYIQAVIPPFSLVWVAMVHDYHMHCADTSFARQYLQNISSVLNWYEMRLQKNNLLGTLDWWQFIDWTKGFTNGIPAGCETGNSAVVSLTYAYALEKAAALFKYYGRTSESQKYSKLNLQIRQAVKNNCFDSVKGLFADTPEKKSFSQHANILAILTGTISDADQPALMHRLLADSSLIQSSIYYKFYLVRALAKSGLGNEYFTQLEGLKKLLEMGFTTFPEVDSELSGGEQSRSDCHAWSASVCYDYFSVICGINPTSPGFKTVAIAPSPGNLKHIKASMPHPAGTIDMDLDFSKNNITGTIILPKAVSGKFVWKNNVVQLIGGNQTINVK